MAEAQHGNVCARNRNLHASASTDITKNARAHTPLAPRPCPCPSVSTACTGIPAWCTPVVELDKLVLTYYFLRLSLTFLFRYTHFLPVPLTFSFNLLLATYHLPSASTCYPSERAAATRARGGPVRSPPRVHDRTTPRDLWVPVDTCTCSTCL